MFNLFMILLVILTYSCSQKSLLPQSDSKPANNSADNTAASSNSTLDNKNYFVSLEIGSYKQVSAKTPANSTTVIIMQKFNADSAGDPSGILRNCKLFLDTNGSILGVHSNTDYNYTVDKNSTPWNISAKANPKATSQGARSYTETYDSNSDSITYNSGNVKNYLSGQTFKVTTDENIGALNIIGNDAPKNMSDIDTLCDNANQGGSDVPNSPMVNATITFGDAGKYDQLVYLVGDSMNYTAFLDDLNSNTYGGVTGSSIKTDGLKPFNIPASIIPADTPLSVLKFKSITTGNNSTFCNTISNSLAFSEDKTSIKINPIDLTNLQLSQNFSTAIQCQFSITNGQKFVLVFNKTATDWCSQAKIVFARNTAVNNLQLNYNAAKKDYDDENNLLTIANNNAIELANQLKSKSDEITRNLNRLNDISANQIYKDNFNKISDLKSNIKKNTDEFNSRQCKVPSTDPLCILLNLTITNETTSLNALQIAPIQTDYDTANKNYEKSVSDYRDLEKSIDQNKKNIESFLQSLDKLESKKDSALGELNTYILKNPDTSNALSSTIYFMLNDKTTCEFDTSIVNLDFSNPINIDFQPNSKQNFIPDLSIISGFRNLSKITLPQGFKIDPQLFAILKSHTQLTEKPTP